MFRTMKRTIDGCIARFKQLASRSHLRSVGRFLISGGLAATVEYGVFLLLHALFGDIFILATQTISFLCGFVVSFTLNKKWVFKSDGRVRRELVRYAMLATMNLVITNIVIWLLVNEIHVTAWIAKIAVMAMVVAWNYVIYQKLIFNTAR